LEWWIFRLMLWNVHQSSSFIVSFRT
jgi:hypothetical protein